MDIHHIGMSARRRHVTAVIAIDTSGSMCSRKSSISLTRLQAASQGAGKVVNSLHEEDHVAILGFGSQIQDVSGGFVELNPPNKAALQRKLWALQPGGRTALYDTILAGCKLVLEMSALAKQVGSEVNEDLGTFWLVVLTDGDDTCSKSSQADAEDVLRKISSLLGTEAMKAIFIGVSLGPNERRKLDALVRAGGLMATFKEANRIEDIQSIFDEIAVKIQATHVRIRPTNPVQEANEEDGPSSWPGPIQKGSHVRCVGQSRGAGSVSIGDVGVVKSRDPDGDFRINFPTQDNWVARPSDVVLDSTAEKVRPGAVVTVKSSVKSPKYGWGSFKRGMQGLVHKVSYDGDVFVQFGFDPNGKASENLWKSQLSDLASVDSTSTHGPWPGHLQPGQAVRVPLRLDKPSTEWGSLQRGEVGYVRSRQPVQSLYVCDFPSVDGWKGRAQDLEVEAVANHIRPGKQVRVRSGVVPSGGWAGVSPSSVGTVVSISYDGSPVVVHFPEHSHWKGTLFELETIDRPKSERIVRTTASGVKNCAGRHGLGPFLAAHASMNCDFCGRNDFPSGTAMFGCRICDTDACAKCYGDTTRKFGINAAIVLKGLSSREGAPLNGQMANVVSYNEDGRYNVRLVGENSKTIAVKESNMMAPVRKHSNGARVVLQNMISQPGLGGRRGKVTGFDSKKGCYTVDCESDDNFGGASEILTVEAFPWMLKVEQHKPVVGESKGISDKADFIGEGMSVREMKCFLVTKGVSIAGAAEKNDLRKLVWETQVSELGAKELELFMQKQGISYDAAWSAKAKREAAEAGYTDGRLPGTPSLSSDFVGEGMSISEMKSYLGNKGVNFAGAFERDDLQNLVWKTQVSELGADDLEEFMRKHTIYFDRNWSIKLKRAAAEEAYGKTANPGYQDEIPIAVAVPMSASDDRPAPSAPPPPADSPTSVPFGASQPREVPVAARAPVSTAELFKKGDVVKLQGLKKETMNGTLGVVETGRVTGGRLEVQLMDGCSKNVWVKVQNVELIEDLVD